MQVSALGMLLGIAQNAAGSTCEDSDLVSTSAAAVPGEYIVRLKSKASKGLQQLFDTFAGDPRHGFVVRVFNDSNAFVVSKSAFQTYFMDTFRSATKGLASGKQPTSLSFCATLQTFLARYGSVFEYVEPNYLYTESPLEKGDDKEEGTWWEGRIGLAESRKRSLVDPNVQIAVLDSGINWTKEDFKGLLWSKSENGRLVYGRNYVSDDPCNEFYGTQIGPCDNDGHGTQVASLIASNGHVSKGVMQRASLMAFKMLGPDDRCGKKNCAPADIAAQAIRDAADAGARVINLSWGGDGARSREIQSALRHAQRKGTLVVSVLDDFSVDNDETKFYPAGFDLPNMIAVGGINERYQIVYGYTAKAMFAPSTSLRVPSLGVDSPNADRASGTSVAAPLVSGAAALVWSLAPGWKYCEVKAYLYDSATRSLAVPPHRLGLPMLNLAFATSAPVDLMPMGDQPWFNGKSRRVTWSPRFTSSTACPRGELLLWVEGEERERQHFGPFRWKEKHADITPRIAMTAPLKATLEARCVGTAIRSDAVSFTLVP